MLSRDLVWYDIIAGGQRVHMFVHGEELKFWSRAKPGTPVATMV
jgi:hypothetical protein